MSSFAAFIRNHRTTFWMLVGTLIFYSFLMGLNQIAEQSPEVKELKKTESFSREDLKNQEEAFKEKIKQYPRLIGFITFAIFLTLLAGLGIDIFLLSRKMRGLPIFQATAPPVTVGWGLREVAQLFIFLFFLEAVIILSEMTVGFFVDIKHWNRDVLLMANSLVRNLGVMCLVLVWAKWRFHARFESIGLTAKDFWKNVKRGIVGYLALIPILFAILLVLSFAAQFFSYEPEPQAVVQIYLKGSSDNILFIFTLFVALVGPVIEEIFFRGFTYTAFRDRFGVRWATIASAFLFALLHMNFIAFIPIFFLGVFLAVLFEKTRSLVPSMTVHMTHNFLMVNAALFFKGIAAS